MRDTATAQELAAYQRRGTRTLATGTIILWLTVALKVAGVFDGGGFWVACAVPLTSGVILTRNAHHMSRVLRVHPWTRCPAHVRRRRFGGPLVTLHMPASDRPLNLKCTLVDSRALTSDGPLWWSGTPERGGVVRVPGTTALVRACPAQRRGRPVFRWLLMLGLIAGCLGIAGSAASEDNPLVELSVVKASTFPGEPCMVRLKDPFTGDHRTSAFLCSEGHVARHPTAEWGALVSYGPFKGDLYNPYLEYPTASDVDDSLLLAGGLLALVGSVGGAHTLYRRRHLLTAAPPPGTGQAAHR
ncbi:hypothetical protein [Streptomyces longispororuber]|uniref:hypothetical protein n=1 Tax=Streptomyces longispororuber TaxID=68230 RepID=UPI00210E7281|nr:hypothetical protein [Streptomyces longispororuber]MCQ4208752.1 hypothetical protein [Streptomyces longispororuber]